MSKRDDLMNDIDIESRASLSAGQRYYLAEMGCSIGTVGTSFLAAVLVVTSNPRTWVTAVVAAMPAMFIALQRVIDLRGRRQWYLSRATHLRTLARSLRYEPLEVADAAKKLGELEAEMDRRWIELLGTSAKPIQTPNAQSDNVSR
jgi:hypothetical protein